MKIRVAFLILAVVAVMAMAVAADEVVAAPNTPTAETSWILWKQLCPMGADLFSTPTSGYWNFLVICVSQIDSVDPFKDSDTWLWKDVCPSPIQTIFEPGVGTHAVCDTFDRRISKGR